jgi:hypoxanthine phosphoribosyltransferase
MTVVEAGATLSETDPKAPPLLREAGGEPTFAHPSEAEFARILDFYQIRWLYEPRSFPLRQDASGRVIERFTPDFYLPDLDLYIELTTLKQSLVTKKNRKLRRLRELFPEVNVKLLYRRDFLNLARKYGLRLDAPAAAPAGTPA